MHDKVNGTVVRDGKDGSRVFVSWPRRRLFVGNIPKAKSRELLLDEFQRRTRNLLPKYLYLTLIMIVHAFLSFLIILSFLSSFLLLQVAGEPFFLFIYILKLFIIVHSIAKRIRNS